MNLVADKRPFRTQYLGRSLPSITKKKISCDVNFNCDVNCDVKDCSEPHHPKVPNWTCQNTVLEFLKFPTRDTKKQEVQSTKNLHTKITSFGIPHRNSYELIGAVCTKFQLVVLITALEISHQCQSMFCICS